MVKRLMLSPLCSEYLVEVLGDTPILQLKWHSLFSSVDPTLSKEGDDRKEDKTGQNSIPN